MMIRSYLIFFLAMAAICVSAEDVTAYTTNGTKIIGPAKSAGGGNWSIGTQNFKIKELLQIRFAPGSPPKLDAGVFVRGGSLLVGTLHDLIGENAHVISVPFGYVRLNRDDLSGAFFPPPKGQSDLQPVLANYSGLLSGALGSFGAALTPGKICRLRFVGQDEMLAEKLMRVGPEQILLSGKNKAVETLNRHFVRTIELNSQPMTPAVKDEEFGPEIIVRLKAGDLIRGRALKMADEELTLKTAFMGDRRIPRNLIAAVFNAGGELADGCGYTWLSTLKPEKSIHTPVFDADFPARYDASNSGGDMGIRNEVCERGIGVHSKSELVYALDGVQRKFAAVVGIDNETNGRGNVTAQVLADGKVVWQSGEISGKNAPQFISVDLGSTKTLTLLVDYGADKDDSGDHFDWGWAAVIKK